MTTLILIRHGQSTANLNGTFTGWRNVPLTELGLRQAENTARYLKENYPVTAVYSSTLMRSMQTAIPTANAFGLQLRGDPDLREIDGGDWEGIAYDELIERYPDSYGDVWHKDTGNAKPDNGEAVVDQAKRVYAAIDRILAENRGGCVAVFTHAMPIRLMRARWEHIEARQLKRITAVTNASISAAAYEDDGSFRVLLYSFDAHQGTSKTALPGTV